VAWLRDVSIELPEDIKASGVNPASPWFVQALKATPRVHLNDSQRAALRRDGAIFLKGVIPDQMLMDVIRNAAGNRKGNPEKDWRYNGHMHALVKYGPLAELSASAMDVDAVALWNTQVEPRPGLSARKGVPWPEKPWYDPHYGVPTDQSVHEDTDAFVGLLHRSGHFTKPQASIFLALTPIPRGLELLAGSHVANQRHRCRRVRDVIPLDCMDRLEKDCHGFLSYDMEPGDVVFFYGSTFHWTVLREQPRVALSVRYVPADMMYTGAVKGGDSASYYPWKCAPIGSAAFPVYYAKNATLTEQPWPLWPKNKDNSLIVQVVRRLLFHLDTRCGPINDF